MQQCHVCYEEFKGFPELARHIISQKKTHNGKSLVWAMHFLADKNNVREFKPRSPMSEEARQIIKDCVRELSGESEIVKTLCPSCKQLSNQRIEAEYIVDREAWRNSKGTLIVNCGRCRREK
jgi:hypothetical protein